ncbi:MAG: response regulator [Alkalispirochaeta sp.]
MAETQKRVFLVEDEVFVSMSLSLDLRKAGYDVANTQATGEGAVAFLREHTVDVVLMDIGLAGDVDGVEAAHQIRTFSTVPIVFMTGYANREQDPAVSAIQPAGFLAKPVSFRRLQGILESV